MIPAPQTTPSIIPIWPQDPALRSHHTAAGHIHFFVRNGSPVSCCIEPRGISHIIPRPAEIHPASFIYHNLRFEALRVGGTIIIVRDGKDVLEEIYLDKHLYLLTKGIYTKTPLTDEVRELMNRDYIDNSHLLIEKLFEPIALDHTHKSHHR